MDKQQLLQTHFPQLDIRTMKKIGEGYDSEAYLVNEELIFKFPKHQIAAQNLQKEIHVLQNLGDLPLPIPRPRYIGPDFYGYEKLAGVVLTPQRFRTLEASTQEQIAQDLAQFLKALHQVKIEQPIQGLALNWRDKFQEDFQDVKEIAFPLLSAEKQQQICEIFEKLLIDERFVGSKAVLCHHDLSADHLLFDEKTQRLCGVLDFGDVALFDRDLDFYYFLTDDPDELGKDFGLKVAHYYGHPDVAGLAQKVQLLSEVYWPFEQLIMGKYYGLTHWHEEGLTTIQNTEWGF